MGMGVASSRTARAWPGREWKRARGGRQRAVLQFLTGHGRRPPWLRPRGPHPKQCRLETRAGGGCGASRAATVPPHRRATTIWPAITGSRQQKPRARYFLVTSGPTCGTRMPVHDDREGEGAIPV